MYTDTNSPYEINKMYTVLAVAIRITVKIYNFNLFLLTTYMFIQLTCSLLKYLHSLLQCTLLKYAQKIIIIIIIIITFMHGIYTYIPETNYVPREYSVAAILLLLFMVLISLVSVLNLLYFYISTLRSMCAVADMAVFWSSLTSCFPGMLCIFWMTFK